MVKEIVLLCNCCIVTLWNLEVPRKISGSLWRTVSCWGSNPGTQKCKECILTVESYPWL